MPYWRASGWVKLRALLWTLWGLPPDQLKQLPCYDPDVAKNRTQARQIMEKLGYGPNNHLNIKVSASEIRAVSARKSLSPASP